MDAPSSPLQLHLRSILRNRIPKKFSRFIPGFLFYPLERLIRQNQLNDLLRFAFPAQGSHFAQKILNRLDIEVISHGLERLNGRSKLVFASNHPLGGLDGIALVYLLGSLYGDKNIRVLVNDILMNVQPLADVFLPVNKYGSQARHAARLINDAYKSDLNICVFPAGLVSRIHDDGKIRDLEWQKTFVSKALDFDRQIVPVAFKALNSTTFYRIARFRKKTGLKVNLEQALLPSEIFKQRGKKFIVRFGQPIDVRSLRQQGLSPAQIAHRLRAESLSLLNS